MSKKKSRYPKRLRTTYYNMNQRCYNPNAKGYKYYGGKGVIICEEWLRDKNTFYEWAVNNGYTDELSIDRIETEGNYEPSNCRWITMIEQQSNRTNNVFVEVDGEAKTIAQWSQETGISAIAIKNRVEQGKDMLDDYSHINIEINGEIKTLKELSEESGILYSTLAQRYRDQWNINDLINPLKETQYIEINGEIHTITEWSNISGLPRDTILKRVSYGWKNEDLLKPKRFEGNKKYYEINGESHTSVEWCAIVDIGVNTFYKRQRRGLIGEDLIKPTH